MPENTMCDNLISVGKHTFPGPVVNPPVAQNAHPSDKQITKLWGTARILGELGWASDLLYISEYLVNTKMTEEENRACHKDICMYFRRYCPNVRKDVTNMELHAAIVRELETYRPRFSKRDLQALFLAYQRWQRLSGNSLPNKRMKAWVGRGLGLIMASRYYKEAVSKHEDMPLRQGGRRN